MDNVITNKDQEYFKLIIEISSDEVFIVDLNDDKIITTNKAFADHLGYSCKEIIGKTYSELGLCKDLEQYKKIISALTDNGSFVNREIDFRRKDGSAFVGAIAAKLLKLNSGDYIFNSMQIISGQSVDAGALQESENKLIAAQKLAHIGDWELNIETNVMVASEEAYHIYGLEDTSRTLTLEAVQKLVLPEFRKMLDDKLSGLINKEEYDVEYKIKQANTGEILYISSKAELQCDENGRPIKVFGTIQDISETRRAEEKLLYLSNHDQLTGLYNRDFFEREIGRLDVNIALPLSIIIGDINGLKLIDDAFGHEGGDKLVVETTAIIKQFCRKGDIFARTGGDEFSILLPRTDRETAYEILEGIQAACKEHNRIAYNNIFHISLSFGFGTKENADENFMQAMKEAEDYMNQRKILEKDNSQKLVVSSIKEMLLEKSCETESHAERMVVLSKAIGTAIGLSQQELDQLELLATLHDIGKVAINDKLLCKPGKLNEEEWAEIKRHPEIGYKIATSSPELVLIADYILSHHEQWDGTGYPQKLAGEEIPTLSRILSVVDAYDAMTQDRPYRKAMKNEEAIAEIEKNAGTQFDPFIAEVFIEMVLGKG